MPLPKDRWPNFHFYDVRTDKRVKVHHTDVRLKSGSTKGHGPGRYFQVVAIEPGRLNYNLHKFISEERYEELKDKMRNEGSRSRRKSRTTSRRKPSRCNVKKSNVKKTKAECKRSKKCSWVKGTRSARKSRKGYCRKA